MSRLSDWYRRMQERKLANERDRAYWRLRDARDDHSSWAFGRAPSENHRNEMKIEKLKAKLEELDRRMGNG